MPDEPDEQAAKSNVPATITTLTRLEIIFQFPLDWRRMGPLLRRILDLKSAGNYETLLDDSMRSGCRLGVRRQGSASGGGRAAYRRDLLQGSVNE